MSTTPIFAEKPYARDCEAVIVDGDDGGVFLDRTVFYPRGGGQPGDSGVLVAADGTRWEIVDTVRGEAGAIRHRLAEGLTPPPAGTSVRAEIDWPRRYRHMRMHTCLHLLGSLVPAGVTGGSVGEARSRLDFDAGDLTLEPEALTRELNALVAGGYPVTIEQVEESVLDERPDLVRTMSVAPPRGVGTLRMIRVEGVDYQPCGGTHVANTREIGPVRVTKVESKGRRNRRVQVVLDEAAP